MSEVDAAASHEFLQALVAQLKRSSSEDGQDIEYVIEHLIPVLVPGAFGTYSVCCSPY